MWISLRASSFLSNSLIDHFIEAWSSSQIRTDMKYLLATILLALSVTGVWSDKCRDSDCNYCRPNRCPAGRLVTPTSASYEEDDEDCPSTNTCCSKSLMPVMPWFVCFPPLFSLFFILSWRLSLLKIRWDGCVIGIFHGVIYFLVLYTLMWTDSHKSPYRMSVASLLSSDFRF